MALFDDTADSRTERPTERRRRQARERGMVARSVELLVAARLLAIWIVLVWWFASFATSAASSLRDTFEHVGQTPPQPTIALSQLREVAWRFATTSSWPLLTATAAILLAHFVQVGWLWRWENAAPQPSRLSPTTGLQRLFSSAMIGRALGLVLKLAIVTSVSGFVVFKLLPTMPSHATTGLSDHLTTFESNVLQLVAPVTIALLTYGVLDYVWQRWRFERSLQMTREEVREELKEIEGNPHWKNHRNAIARQPSLAPLTADAHPRDHS